MLMSPRGRATLTALALVVGCAARELQAADRVGLKVGDAAPVFETQDHTGKVWRSKDWVGKKTLVVFFYPAAMTPGCTKQACGFRDDRKKLEQAGVEVVGVSGDDATNLALFRKAHNLNFPLLADPDGAVAKQFGVPMRDGGEIKRTVDGVEHVLKRGVTASRWTFVIDKSGKVIHKNTKVKAAEDSQAILNLMADASGGPPKVGRPARDFTLDSLRGKPVTLSKLTGKSPVVLVVLRGYPGYQ